MCSDAIFDIIFSKMTNSLNSKTTKTFYAETNAEAWEKVTSYFAGNYGVLFSFGNVGGHTVTIIANKYDRNLNNYVAHMFTQSKIYVNNHYSNTDHETELV